MTSANLDLLAASQPKLFNSVLSGFRYSKTLAQSSSERRSESAEEGDRFFVDFLHKMHKVVTRNARQATVQPTHLVRMIATSTDSRQDDPDKAELTATQIVKATPWRGVTQKIDPSINWVGGQALAGS